MLGSQPRTRERGVGSTRVQYWGGHRGVHMGASWGLRKPGGRGGGHSSAVTGAHHREVRAGSGQSGSTGRLREKGGHAQWARGAESARGEARDWAHSTAEAKMTHPIRCPLYWLWGQKGVKREKLETTRSRRRCSTQTETLSRLGVEVGTRSVTRRRRDPKAGATLLLCGCNNLREPGNSTHTPPLENTTPNNLEVTLSCKICSQTYLWM